MLHKKKTADIEQQSKFSYSRTVNQCKCIKWSLKEVIVIISSGSNPLPTMSLPRVSVSFAGCGFLGLYHVGSLAAWRDHDHLVTVEHALGSSAGAIVAAALVLGIDTQYLKERSDRRTRLCRNILRNLFLLRFESVAKEVTSLPLGPLNPKFNVNNIFNEEMIKVNGVIPMKVFDRKPAHFSPLSGDFRGRPHVGQRPPDHLPDRLAHAQPTRLHLRE